ncbi:universal stress protein [Haloarculaceae archaeon H-GB2-1]|nr:universal stress protein [Haloarculaceae archaeon H-GB1-1]MEA5387949.1 universal stress protein [Haloarculaceae archaeon H-GB11]MEA5409441.1 universal stress protein [Haloarculaceae archaeon H-GB2-1]
MAILTAVKGDSSPENILRTGADLADAYDDTLYVVSVLPEEEYRKRRRDMESESDEVSYTVEDAQSSARQQAQTLVAESGIEVGDVEFRSRVGKIDTEILAIAEAIDARYVVIGGRKRTPTGKALFGSVTQRILLNADRPVVTVMQEE